MSKIVIWCSIGLTLVISFFAFDWSRSKNEVVPFPDGYLLRERPSIVFDGYLDHLIDELFYDLVIEDVVEFIVVRDWVKRAPSDQESVRSRYNKLTRAASQDECAAAALSPELRVLSSVWRSNFDLLRGRCVIIQPVDQIDADLRILEHDDYWAFEVRSTGREIARAPKAYRHRDVRALFDARASVSQQPGSPVFEDDFTDTELVRAIESGGYATAAAIKIIQRRARIEDRGLVPEISVRRAISPEVLEAMLQLVPVGKDPAPGFRLGFHVLIPGASKETAELIYPKMIEMLYAPFKASKPHGPWYYGNGWKEQIRDKRPDLEDGFTRDEYVPEFAATVSFRSASALALQLGQPYIKLFYDEFRTEIVNRTSWNSGPSFHTAILAQSEPDLVGIISEIRGKPSPNRIATVWALIEQGSNLPEGFIEELRNGCKGDTEFLNDPRASHKYLGGETFCARYFQSEGARYRQ